MTAKEFISIILDVNEKISISLDKPKTSLYYEVLYSTLYESKKALPANAWENEVTMIAKDSFLKLQEEILKHTSAEYQELVKRCEEKQNDVIKQTTIEPKIIQTPKCKRRIGFYLEEDQQQKL
ncbi:MAG: hypothetical protein IKM43_03860 [Clostridia bacterium]|nr:hypothetical protein [Clostridia bacterium]